MMVKICGITNREDAVAAVEAGASALGFNFYSKSPRFTSPEQARDHGHGLAVMKVGIFVDETRANMEEIARRAGLDAVQLHGDEPAESFADFAFPIWKAFRVSDTWTTEQLDQWPAKAYVLDGPAPGTGEAFDWSRAQSAGHRIILAGGLAADNVAQAIDAVRPWGVDACSRLEESPGRKDHERMRQFITAALAVRV